MSLLDRIILLTYFVLAALGFIGVSTRSLAVLALCFVLSSVFQGGSVVFWQRKAAP